MTPLAARVFGARIVALSDILTGPRQVALDCGADSVLDALSPDLAADAEALSLGGFDVGTEAAGSAAAFGQALAVIKRGGTIVQVGTLPASVTLQLDVLLAREATLAGSFRFANVFLTALALLASGRIDVKPLITSVFPLARINAAMQTAIVAEHGIKVQVEA